MTCNCYVYVEQDVLSSANSLLKVGDAAVKQDRSCHERADSMCNRWWSLLWTVRGTSS